ncbi:MAG: hypothetical protein K9W44_14505 [Candidatus Lokiarchaeota archaeon]|nr:hypothetical protein [Candidatus Harpocratesius repetitus]
MHDEYNEELNQKEPPMKISGGVNIPPGRYNRDIKVSGSCRSDGDIECHFFKASGSVHIGGNLIALEGISSSGSFKVDGTVQSEEDAKFSSSVKVGGNVIVGENLKSSSSFQCKGRLSVEEEAHFSSSAKIGEEVIVGELHVSSTFLTGGLLTSDGDAKFSSSAHIEGDCVIGGGLKASSSFNCRGSVQVDEDAKFSSSATINENVLVSGYLHASSNFSAGGKVVADAGAKFSSNASIGKTLLSNNAVEITGKIEVMENIEASKVFIGANVIGFKFHRSNKVSKIHGSIIAVHEIDIEDTYVDGDLRAERVYLGPNTKIFGTVYYVSEFRADPKAHYANAQQIGMEEL